MSSRNSHRALEKGTLIVFTRSPLPGRSKTRLIGALGAEKAARLQFHMLRRALKSAERVCARGRIHICFDGGTVSVLKSLFGSGWVFSCQKRGDLGHRMFFALQSASAKSPGPLVLIGSDCPSISSDILCKAFAILENRDLVLGPAADGGFYLLGVNSGIMSSRIKRVLTGIDWGTGFVLKQALRRVREAGLTCGFTAELNDVDVPEDLPDDISQLIDPECRRISVIIPALNEAEHIASTLNSLNRADNVQVILADGGSSDQTIHIAGDLGAEIVRSKGGRARQINEGAERANGEILLFAHADTEMPFLYDWHVRRAIQDEGYAGGSFSFSLARPFPGSAWLSLIVNFRSRLLRMPYGDQALFIEQRLFKSMGGFARVPLLEDVILVNAMKRKGRIAILPVAAKTSSRRWIEKGLIKTTLINQLIMYGYYLGISCNTLASLYRR